MTTEINRLPRIDNRSDAELVIANLLQILYKMIINLL